MLAFHAIFTAYGFWLPNDTRGSWSDWVGAWELFRRGGRRRRSARGDPWPVFATTSAIDLR
jgi:hypothetical protein